MQINPHPFIERTYQLRGSYAEWEKSVQQETPQMWHRNESAQTWEFIILHRHTANSYKATEYRILNLIALKAMDAFKHLFNEIGAQSQEKYFGSLAQPFLAVADTYIDNAVDSLMHRLITEKTSYEATLDIRLHFEKGELKIEIEDNGKGINPKIESQLFINQVPAKPRSDIPRFGSKGWKLTNINRLKDIVKGEVRFFNKGQDQGALFSFKVSLDNCLKNPLPEKPSGCILS